ncbi:MAG: DnaJ domain-containing protein [Candidatus Roizmanbacteria bacterium]
MELKKSKRKDYYKVLDITKAATDDEIKKAYKKSALKWHPDKNSSSEETTSEAEKIFKDIGEAYSVLSDPQKRQRYDDGADLEEIEWGHGHGFGGGVNPNDIFQMFFSQGGGGSRQQHSHGGCGGQQQYSYSYQ